MSGRLPVHITPAAATQLRAAEAWWRANRRAAPNAIREELDRALTLIASRPTLGSHARSVAIQDVRRIALPRVGYYVYYHVIGDPPLVEIVAFWHVRRGAGPPL